MNQPEHSINDQPAGKGGGGGGGLFRRWRARVAQSILRDPAVILLESDGEGSLAPAVQARALPLGQPTY